MKAVQFSAFGGVEVLETAEVPSPVPGAGEIVVRVAASGVNPLDIKIRSGQMAGMFPVEFPMIGGSDVAGTVLALGDGVSDVSVGDVVFGSGRGTFAEEAVMTDWAPVPAGTDPVLTAGWGAAVETSVRILDQLAPEPGSTVLVSGASGGVGSALVQLAIGRGLTVIGTSSPQNHDYLTGLGAVPVAYGDGLVGRVTAVAPAGVQTAYDVSGAGVIAELIEIVGDPARVLSISDFTAPQLGAVVSTDSTDAPTAFAEALRLPGFHIDIDRRFPLVDAGSAQEHVAAGHTLGKVVLVP